MKSTKPIKCNEIELSIQQLGEADVSPEITSRIIMHIDQCKLCCENFSHVRQALINNPDLSVPEADDSLWDKLSENVLSRVNELKLDVSLSKQIVNNSHAQLAGKPEAIPDLASYQRGSDLEEGEAVGSSSSTPINKYNKNKSSFLPPRWLPIAASILLVVAVILVIQKPVATFQHQPTEFQLNISKSSNLSEIVRRGQLIEQPAEIYSFSSQSTVVSGFEIGSYYAESLAMLDAVDTGSSLKHLQQLQKKLRVGGSAEVVQHSLQNTVNILSEVGGSREDRVKAIETFASIYQNYLRKNNPNELVYFRLGMWTVDIALASASNNAVLRNEITNIDYFLQSLSTLSAPQGVINGLSEMRDLISKSNTATLNSKQIFQLNKKLRQLLV